MERFTINLQLFAEGEGGGTGEGAGAPATTTTTPAGTKPKAKPVNPLAEVKYGKQPTQEEAPAQEEIPAKKEPETAVTSDTAEARRAEFEKLIKGDYKDLYDERVQARINERFKDTKALEDKAGKADALAPVLDMLAAKYGVDGKDVEAVVKAIQEDNSYYEEEAMKKGLSVQQLKEMKKLERENAEFRKTVQEQERQQNAQKVYGQWQQQSEACAKIYPAFDLQKECNNPETGARFMSILKSGVDVQSAYEVVHKDEIVGGAMQYAAQQVQQKTVNDIKARGMRPPENGAGGSGPAVVVKSDPRNFTRKDREEIARRVMRGERIEL